MAYLFTSEVVIETIQTARDRVFHQVLPSECTKLMKAGATGIIERPKVVRLADGIYFRWTHMRGSVLVKVPTTQALSVPTAKSVIDTVLAGKSRVFDGISLKEFYKLTGAIGKVITEPAIDHSDPTGKYYLRWPCQVKVEIPRLGTTYCISVY